VEVVYAVEEACVGAAVAACAAAVAVADIADSRIQSTIAQLELAHLHQNGETDYVVHA
jgi:hypothetical protein